MDLEIITPEGPIFKSSKVEVLTVPGEQGSFQLLKNHIPIISNLVEGKIKIKAPGEDLDIKYFDKNAETDEIILNIVSGVLENKENKAIVLANLV